MPIRAVLFDFDGTLADSFAPITASTNHVRQHFGLPPLPESEVRHYVGYGLANLMQTLVPIAPTDQAIDLYRSHHERVMLTQTKLMPGVAETIPELFRRGFRQAVCSNKRVDFTRQLVKTLGLAQYFTFVLGPEDVGNQPKPDPAMLLEGLKRLEVSTNEAVYVGDMAIDVHTAQAAKVRVWLVPGGAAGDESAAAAGPNRVL
ncbi:MAG TPA: HAD family hydrolase, partial [Gemmata sp.]|nr:HAD family hydrolase [Gemmata sp.]